MPTEPAAALVTVTSTLGVVIPPSLVLILLSDAMLRAHTEAVNATHAAARIINTQDLFRGALIPAAILLVLCAVITWRAGARREKQAQPLPATRGQLATAALTVLFIVGLFAGVTLGYLYAVEAAATGGVALMLFASMRRAISVPLLRDVLRDAMAVTGALFALLIGATVFTLIVRAFGTDRWVAGLLAGGGGGVYGPLLAVLAILALCAFVLDAFEITFVVVPVVMPPLLMRVPDATWVAVLTLLILQASFLLPPFGYAVLMLRNRLSERIDGKAFLRALLPFLIAQALVVALVIAWPGLLWRDAGQNATATSTTKPMSDEEAEELMRKQTEPEPGQRQ